MTNIFTTVDILKDPSTIVDYSGLVNITLYKSDIQSNANSGFFQVSYNSNFLSEGKVKLKMDKTSKEFFLSNIYLTNLIHNNIQGLTDSQSNSDRSIKGELILESTKKDDGSKIYLCFLIKSIISGSPTNNSYFGLLTRIINNLITDNNSKYNYKDSSTSSVPLGSNISKVELNISGDSSLSNQNNGCICYKDTRNNALIIVFLNPITYINSTNTNTGIKTNFNGFDFDNYLTSKNSFTNFSSYPLNETDKISTENHSNIGDPENGILENDIYIDCNPTGEGEENIKTYKLPINSDLMGDIQNSSLSKLMNNFAMFGVLLLVSYIGIPKVYNMAVCDKMNDEDQYYARIFILFYFIIVIFSLFVDGSVDGDMTELLVGFFFIFLAILTYVLVLDVGSNSDQDFDISVFIIFAVEALSYVLFKPKNLAIIILFFVILMITVCIVKDKDGNTFITTKTGKKTTAWLSLLVIPTFAGLITWIIE